MSRNWIKQKWLRFIIKGLAIVIALWVVLLIVTFLYIRFNKAKIISSIRQSLSEKVTGLVQFDDLDIDFLENFPSISIDVRNVHVIDSAFLARKKELLNVRHAFMSFSFIDLVTGNKSPKKLTLADGYIYFFRDNTGGKNWGLIKVNGEKKFKIEVIKLKNITAIFQDVSKFKYFEAWFDKMKCEIHNKKDRIVCKIETRGIVKAVGFNTLRGYYLNNKPLSGDFTIKYLRDEKKLSLNHQRLKAGGHSYFLSGDFLLTEDPHFNLTIETPALPLLDAASIFPDKVREKISRFQVSTPLRNIKAVLSGPMEFRAIPLAEVSFEVRGADLSVNKTSFKNASFNGYYRNEIMPGRTRDDFNSFISFKDVKAEWENNSFQSHVIKFSNLIHPYLNCDLRCNFDLANIDKTVSSSRLSLQGGKGVASVVYAGPVETSSGALADLTGTVTLDNGSIVYLPRNLKFSQIALNLSFQNGDMLVKKMTTSVNGNKISIDGTVKNLVGFFNSDATKAVFNWNIYSPMIDVGELRSSLRRRLAQRQSSSVSVFQKLNNKIDKLFDECDAYLNITADRVTYKNFTASNVHGGVTLTNDIINLREFALQHAGGSVIVNGSTIDKGNSSDLKLDAIMQNVDVKELFQSFNNFGLQSLTAKNINGRFSAKVNFSSVLDADNNLVKSTNKGVVDFSLKNGRLLNFQPLMDIDNNFLKKRDLADISFAELKDRLELLGNEVKVNRMEVRSTAIGLYVEGIYSFADKTDLSIQIPVKELKKKDGEPAPENKGVNAKAGMSIFLRAKNDNGRIKIGYDLFGRFRGRS